MTTLSKKCIQPFEVSFPYRPFVCTIPIERIVNYLNLIGTKTIKSEKSSKRFNKKLKDDHITIAKVRAKYHLSKTISLKNTNEVADIINRVLFKNSGDRLFKGSKSLALKRMLDSSRLNKCIGSVKYKVPIAKFETRLVTIWKIYQFALHRPILKGKFFKIIFKRHNKLINIRNKFIKNLLTKKVESEILEMNFSLTKLLRTENKEIISENKLHFGENQIISDSVFFEKRRHRSALLSKDRYNSINPQSISHLIHLLSDVKEASELRFEASKSEESLYVQKMRLNMNPVFRLKDGLPGRNLLGSQEPRPYNSFKIKHIKTSPNHSKSKPNILIEQKEKRSAKNFSIKQRSKSPQSSMRFFATNHSKEIIQKKLFKFKNSFKKES